MVCVAVPTLKSLREFSCGNLQLNVFNSISEQLESLDIDIAIDNSLEIAKSVVRLTSLRHVNIFFSHINEEIIVALMTSLSHCHTLETLRLSSSTEHSNKLAGAVKYLIPGSPHPGFPLLKDLNISKFNTEDIASLASAALNGKLPKLENLDISGNELENTLKHFCGDEKHPTFPSLKNLEVRRANLNSKDVASLGVAIKNGNFPKLESLDLRSNNFGSCQTEVETLIKNCTEKSKRPSLKLNLLNTDVEPEFRSKILQTYASQSVYTNVIIYI